MVRVPDGSFVVVSAGTKNFHLLMTAEEIHARGALAGLICGPYPTKAMKAFMPKSIQGADRFLAREVNVPLDKVRPIFGAELLQAVAFALRRIRGNVTHSGLLDQWTLHYYHRAAARILKSYGGRAKVYHYRAGFGGRSLELAKHLGMIRLCDHSLADPRLLPSYLKGDEHVEAVNVQQLDTVSQAIVYDIEHADLVLVNSDFVKETLTSCGVPADRIIVNYLGVDEAYVKLIPQHRDRIRQESPSHLNLLFAGFFGRRKGADVLLDALATASNVDWTLTIAGGTDPRVAQQYSEIMGSERVRVLGAVSRSRLAELMVEADLFVLPSRAEGSARVIFEALACACPVLTTPESGSIIKHHKHGFLVRRNSVSDIVDALQQADRDRGQLRLMAEAAQSEVLSTFRQSHYGERLMAAYRDALSRCRQ